MLAFLRNHCEICLGRDGINSSVRGEDSDSINGSVLKKSVPLESAHSLPPLVGGSDGLDSSMLKTDTIGGYAIMIVQDEQRILARSSSRDRVVSTGTKLQRERGEGGEGGKRESSGFVSTGKERERERARARARAQERERGTRSRAREREREKEQVPVYHQSLHTCNRVSVVSMPAYVHVLLNLLAHDPASAGEAIGNLGV